MGPYYDNALTDLLGGDRLIGLTTDPRGNDRDGLIWYGVIFATLIAIVGLASPETPATTPEQVAALEPPHSSRP